jgi:hypothetical protein
MMEGIVRDAVIIQMESFIAPQQHGFLSGRSCTTQLLDTLEHWTKMLDEGLAIDVVYLDFAKAFDSVPHRRLLAKLDSYGIRGKVLRWIAHFLIGRKQRVMINGTASEWGEVLSGVPQGSVLGPVLFICFINDMPEEVQSLIRIFADDTKIFAKVMTDDDQRKLQEDINALKSWSDRWQMKFNAGKCSVMHLGYHNSNREYQMGDEASKTTLKETKCEKDLGVHVDPSLQFSQHCAKAASRANQLVGLIKRSFCYLDKDMMTKLIKGLVRPVLEYGNAAWSPLFKKDANAIEKVQRRATRLVPALRELEYEDRLRAMKLPSLAYRRLRGDMIDCYKFTHGLYKVNPNILVPDKKHESEHETRGHDKRIPEKRGRLEIRKNAFTVRVAHTWNNLPKEVVEAPSVDSFKSRIDRHFKHLKFSTEMPLIPRYQRWEERHQGAA